VDIVGRPAGTRTPGGDVADADAGADTRAEFK